MKIFRNKYLRAVKTIREKFENGLCSESEFVHYLGGVLISAGEDPLISAVDIKEIQFAGLGNFGASIYIRHIWSFAHFKDKINGKYEEMKHE